MELCEATAQSTRTTTAGRALLFIVGALAALTMSGAVLRGLVRLGTLDFICGDWVPDRWLFVSMARTAMEYGPSFLDPCSRQEPVFYQFFWWWIVGGLARLTHMEPWAVCNMLQLVLAPVLFAAMYGIARRLSSSRPVALLAVGLCVLFGNLEFLLTPFPPHTYGEHAIMLPFLKLVSAFSADNAALAFGLLAVAMLLDLTQTDSRRHQKWKPAALVATASLCMLSHLLVGMLMVLACGMILMGRCARERAVSDRACLLMAVPILAVYVGGMVLARGQPPMWLLGGVGVATGLAVVACSRDRRPALLMAGSTVAPGIYVAVALLVIAGSGGTAFHYNDGVRTRHLAIPIVPFVVSYLPVLALGAYSLCRTPDPALRRTQLAIAAAAVLACYNNAFGYNNHPYRFITYSMPLICPIAAEGLALLCTTHRSRAGYAMAGLTSALLAAGIWANVVRYQTHYILPVPSHIREIAKAIDAIRQREPKAVFGIAMRDVTQESLTPEVAARFFGRSVLQPERPENLFGSLFKNGSQEQVLRVIRENHLAMDYVVIGTFSDFHIVPVR